MNKRPTLTKNGIVTAFAGTPQETDIPPFDTEYIDTPKVTFDDALETTESAGEGAMTFTVFSPPKGVLIGKYFAADDTKRTYPFPPQMRAVQKTMNLTQLAKSIRAGFFLTSGIFDVPEALVVPKRAAEPNGGKWPVRHRGKAEMKRPEGSGLMVIDNDFAETKGDTMRLLLSVAPELATCARLVKASSGSNVTGASGNVVRGMQGEHIIFACENAADTEHNLRVLHQRLMIAKLDNCNVTNSGRFNERSAVDLQLRHPWQPVFLAATLDEEVTQDLDIEVTPGTLLGRLPNLTPEEEAAYLTARAARHDELIPLMEKTRGEWIDSRVAEGWSRATAIRALATGELERDAKIMLADGAVVTVADIIAAPDKYNFAITCDPLEPGYRGFADVGILYMEGRRPMLFSQAHGGMKFWLPRTTATDDFGVTNGDGDPDFPQDFGPAESDEIELPAVEPWGADPEAAKWKHVKPEEVGAGFDLGAAELADGVALPGGLALADGRVVRLTNKNPAIRLIEAARESGDVGAVAKALAEIIIPALGSSAAITFAAEQFRKLSDLGGDKAEVKEAVTELCRKHAGRIVAFAKRMAPCAAADQPEDDPADVAQQRRMARLAAEKAAAEAKAAWLKSFEHIANNPFGELPKALAAIGLAGDVTGGVVGYMTITSSAFNKPDEQMKSSLRGATGIGKSEALKAAMKLCPDEAYHMTDGGSPTSLIYMRNDDDPKDEPSTFYIRRCLILPEADALLHDAKEGDAYQAMVKVMLSEGSIGRDVTVPGAPGELPQVKTVRQKGPTNLLTTSTHAFESQMENRVLGFELNQTPDNERTIKQARATIKAGASLPDYDVTPWHEYGRWLREDTKTIILPFAPALAALHPAEHGLRNLNLLFSVSATAALMNKANREMVDGQIVATIDDYAVAWELLHTPSDRKIDAAVDPSTVEVFRKIEAHINAHGVSVKFGDDDPGNPSKRLTISQRELAKISGLPKSTFNRKFNDCTRADAPLLHVERPAAHTKPLTIWVAEGAETHLQGDAEQQLPTPTQVLEKMREQ